MDDVNILKRLKENCGNDEVLKDFTQELFIEEYNGLYAWNSKYDKLIDKYSDKRE